jgi:hypothetical protein
MTNSPDKLFFVATGGADGWVPVSDVTGVVPNSAAFVYDHDSGPLGVTIQGINVTDNKLLLWANGQAINASGYTVGNGATIAFPGGSYSNPSVPINTSGMLAPYVLNGVGDTVPFTINAAGGQTTKLQSWQVAGLEKAYIDADGVAFSVPLWQTYPKDPKSGVGPLDLTREPYFDTDHYMIFMRRGVEESLSFIWSMPHGWVGSNVQPHIHIIPCADPTEIQYVWFKAAYCWTTEAGLVPQYSSWTHITPFQWAINPGDLHKQFKVAFPVITTPAQPPDLKALLWHFERVADEPEDTYASSKLDPGNPDANLAIIGIDLLFQTNSRGTIIQ